MEKLKHVKNNLKKLNGGIFKIIDVNIKKLEDKIHELDQKPTQVC